MKTKDIIIKNKKALLIALENALGIVTSACKTCNISRNQFYIYYKEDESFRKSVDDIKEIVLDFVENALLKKIKDGDMAGIQFHLKYQGRRRGYGIDRTDITSNGETIFKVIVPDEEDKEDKEDKEE